MTSSARTTDRAAAGSTQGRDALQGVTTLHSALPKSIACSQKSIAPESAAVLLVDREHPAAILFENFIRSFYYGQLR